MTSKTGVPHNNLRISLVLTGLLLVFAGYYVFHQQFQAESVGAIGICLYRIIIVLLIISFSGTTGRFIISRAAEHDTFNPVIQAGLGLGITSIYILLAGSIAGINWITMGLIPLVVWLILWRHAIEWLRSLFHFWGNIWRDASRFEKGIAFFTGIILFTTLISALAPPLKYDALMYHLVMPQTYLQQGRISHIPWLVMSGMPQATEMLYTLSAWYGGLSAAAVTGWGIGVLAVLGLVGFFQTASDVKTRRIGWVAAASLLAGETFAASLSWAYVDWTGLFFGVCCLYVLREWLNGSQSGPLALAGIFAGLAFTSKYTGGILLLCAFTCVIWELIKQKKSSKEIWKPVIFFTAGSMVFPAVWLLRNLIITGNPLYPFFLPAAEMDTVRLAVYQGAVPYGEWWEGLLLPVRATLWGLESAEGYSVSIGPLLLILGLANLLRNRPLEKNDLNALRLGVCFFLAGWIFWAFGNRVSGYLIQTRMYFSIFPALAIIAAMGWDTIREMNWQKIRISRVFGLVMFVSLGFSTVRVVLQTVRQDSSRVITGMISTNTYEDENLGWYARAARSMGQLPEGSRVLFLYEPRGLACTPTCDPDEILDQWKISRKHNSSDNSVLLYWKQQGYNYLLVNHAGMEFLADGSDPHHPIEEINALDGVLKHLPVEEKFGDGYQLYKLP